MGGLAAGLGSQYYRPQASAPASVPIPPSASDGASVLPSSGAGTSRIVNGRAVLSGSTTPAAASGGSYVAPPPAPVTTAQVDPALTALSKRYSSYLDTLPTNQSRQSEIAAQQSRDAAEGGRTALTESAAFRGEGAAPALAAYDATTEQAEQSAIANEEVANTAAMGSAIQGGLPITEAPTTEALAESAANLNSAALGASEEAQTFNQNLSTNQNQFNQYLQLLAASRMNPIYGYGSPVPPGGAYGTYGMGSVAY